MRSLFRSKFRITQEFGVNYDYYKQFGLKGHEGIDLVPTGTVWDVLALADGVVVKDEDNLKSGAYGNNVTLWHPQLRKATQYCHFNQNYVGLGDRVKQGDKIGLMGNSGNTTGAHVHLNLFEVDDSGIRLNKNNGFLGGIDPLPFLNEEAPPDTTALEECKRQVEREIQAKNETYQELEEKRTDLEAEKRQREFLEGVIKQYANILGVGPDTAEIAGAIQKLVGNEDTIQKLNRNIEVLTQQLNESNNAYEELKEGRDALAIQLDATRSDLVSLEGDKKWLTEKLKECSDSTEYIYTHLIFGLFTRRKK